VFARIGEILEEAGSGLDRVVDITTYHLDMHAHIDAFIQAKNESLPNSRAGVSSAMHGPTVCTSGSPDASS
jgi:enamine deaminase RidA (YjgF/YER057c/UK114 family)